MSNRHNKRSYSPRRHYDDYRDSRDSRRDSYSRRRSPSPDRKRSKYSNDKNDHRNSSHRHYDERRDVIPHRDEKKDEKKVIKEKTVTVIDTAEVEKKEKEKQEREHEEYHQKIQQQLEHIETNEEEEIRKAKERRMKRMQAMAVDEPKNEPVAEGKTESKPETVVSSAPSSPSDEEKIIPQQTERQHFLEQLEKERDRRDEEHHHTPPPTVEKADDDDEFDMFSGEEINTPSTTVAHGPRLTAHQLAQTDNPNLSANWNDEEGYYAFRIGEIILDRYQVLGFHGKGVFGTVLRAMDTTTKQEVAIKVVRNNEWMKKSGMKEYEMLVKLNNSDPQDKCHCVRALGSFQFRNHLCIVFEGLAMDLRSLIKKYGKEQGRQVGISMEGVRLYTLQLFIALKHLRVNNILHADIKPDNILANEKGTVVKLCDFGSGSDASENAITPYLVSRFYRAPEIVLGMRYSYPIDVWSIGCSLYELFTGEILFQSTNNNHLLLLVQQVKGPFTAKMLKKCLFRDRHFDHTGAFLSKEEDPITQTPMIRRINGVPKTRDLKTELLAADENSEYTNNRKRILQLADLLEKCLALDPVRRITVDEALEHPFLTS